MIMLNDYQKTLTKFILDKLISMEWLSADLDIAHTILRWFDLQLFTHFVQYLRWL